MDYEKKIREYLNSNEVDQLYKSMLINLFPELKESEDEKIRKLLINGMKSLGYRVETFASIPIKDIIAWLENQKELKYLDTSDCEPWSDEQTRKNIINFLKSLGATEIPKASYNSYMKWLEKQGEQQDPQELFDTAKRQGYKEGLRDGRTEVWAQIEKQGDKDKPTYSTCSKDVQLTQEEYDKRRISDEATIKEVEAYKKGLEDAQKIFENQGKQKPPKYSLEQAACIFLDALSLSPYNNKPITDAQIITKELLNFLLDASSYNPDALNKEPVEWSEEDEGTLACIIGHLSTCLNEEAYKKYKSWLKSLKGRYAWKPSIEQLDALYDVLNPSVGVDKKALESLYEQLKAIGCE